MRVAALYDVHGHAPALEAVLADVGEVDTILLGGDIASGPFPRETMDIVVSLDNAVAVRGNADEVLNLSAAMDDVAVAGRRWVAERLTDDELQWLASLPLAWSADDTLYVHANPVDPYEAVVPATPDARIAELLAGVAERRVVTGHVHLQFEREVDGIRWIGAGSVGFPYEDEPAAYWVLVDDGEVSFRRTDYDVERADAAIVASGHPRAAGFAELRAQGAEWVGSAR